MPPDPLNACVLLLLCPDVAIHRRSQRRTPPQYSRWHINPDHCRNGGNRADGRRWLLLWQWTSPDTIGAVELFWRGVLDPGDRALDQALVAQPRLAFWRGRVNRR